MNESKIVHLGRAHRCSQPNAGLPGDLWQCPECRQWWRRWGLHNEDWNHISDRKARRLIARDQRRIAREKLDFDKRKNEVTS